jgi:hypothetical protein
MNNVCDVLLQTICKLFSFPAAWFANGSRFSAKFLSFVIHQDSALNRVSSTDVFLTSRKLEVI